MKWKKRQREIKRLRAEHAGKRWSDGFPNLKSDKPGLAPTSNRFDYIPNEGPYLPQPPNPKHLVVDHLHKSSLQVLLPSELPWAGGKKP